MNIFSSISNSELIENRKLYRNRSFSKDFKISKKAKNEYFGQDYYHEFTNTLDKSNTMNFLSSNRNEDKINDNKLQNNENFSNKKSSVIYPDITVEENKSEDLLNNKNKFELNNHLQNENKDENNKKNNSNNNLIKLKKEIIKNNTIFIFDWDDTLFFTTHLEPNKKNLLISGSPLEKRMMKTIEYYVEEILIKALSKGTVLIITNSSEGWVEYCTYSYYPNLIPLLKQINIISARALYEKDFPSQPLTWKINAFNDLTKKFNFEKCLLTNIICIGDDNIEIIAAKKLANNFDNCLIKTIKLREGPNLKELIKQLVLINEQILRVFSYPKSLNIHVDKKENPKKNTKKLGYFHLMSN